MLRVDLKNTLQNYKVEPPSAPRKQLQSSSESDSTRYRSKSKVLKRKRVPANIIQARSVVAAQVPEKKVRGHNYHGDHGESNATGDSGK